MNAQRGAQSHDSAGPGHWRARTAGGIRMLARSAVARVALCVPVSVLGLLAGAAPARGLPTAKEVEQRMAAARASIRDLTFDMAVHLDIPGMRIPDVAIRVYLKHPAKVKLKPLRGFAVLPKKAVYTGDPFAELCKHAAMKVVGAETVSGRPAYRLRFAAQDGEHAGSGTAWVDRERWVTLKIEAGDAAAPGVLEFHYQRHQGRYWLPSRTVARLRMPAPPRHRGHDPSDPDDAPPPAPDGGKGGPAPAPRAGTVTATFRNYRVNTGLPDSLFKEDEAPKPRRQVRERGRPR